jgi:hypothetical protein
MIKKLLLPLRFPIDFILAVLSLPSALILLGYRKFGSGRLPATTRLLKRIGLFPLRNHYYEPLFDDRALKTPLSEDRQLPGVDLNEEGQLSFLGRLTHAGELKALAWDQLTPERNRFSLQQNGSFLSGDAEFLYQFIRTVKPSRIIEIGCGHSTRVAKLARDANAAETGRAASHLCIEPYEMPWLEELGIQVLRRKVEDCDLDWTSELQAGDLLFIDSSHVIRPQGDVLYEYLRIIPTLRSGVYVHIHDIFTPKDYLREWVVDEVKFWNEQYLMEALLSNGARYEVIAGLNFLKHHHYAALKQACPYLEPGREPGSFYFRVR